MQLVDPAQGPFICTATSIRFTEPWFWFGFPEERLEKVLDASAHGEPQDKLDDLYQIIRSTCLIKASSMPCDRCS